MKHFCTQLFLFLCLASYAQNPKPAEPEKLFTSDPKDNWFIGSGVGAGVSNHVLKAGFNSSDGSTVNYLPPYTKIFVGKWLTPGIGLRLEAGAWAIKAWMPKTSMAITYPDNTGGPWDDQIENTPFITTTTTNIYQKIYGFDVHGDFLFNLNNLLGGYNENRKNSFTLYAGTGYTAFKVKDSSDVYRNLILDAGLIFEHKFSKSLAFFADIKETTMPLYFNLKPHKVKYEGFISLTAGLTYTFAGTKRGFRTTFLPEEREKLNKEINELHNRNEQLRADNERISKEYNDLKTEYEKATQSVTELKQLIKKYNLPVNSKILLCDYVSFGLNESKFQEEEEKSLKSAAEELAKSEDCIIEVFGYADPKTGTRSYNMNLSKKRAEYVAKILKTKYNVPEEKIKISYLGVNQAPLENKSSNKIALFFLSKDKSAKIVETDKEGNNEVNEPIVPPADEQPKRNNQKEEKVKKSDTLKTKTKYQESGRILFAPAAMKPGRVIAKEIMQPGSRLTLLAEKYYGNKIFWVYIYDANKSKIKNPDNVQAGTEIDIPAQEHYGIESESEQSIKNARDLIKFYRLK